MASSDAGRQARTLEELVLIREYNRELLRERALGSAVGLRVTAGAPTSSPAVLALVSQKVHENWIPPTKLLPRTLEAVGPHGPVSCQLDVVLVRETLGQGAWPSSSSSSSSRPLHRLPLIRKLCGRDVVLGPGSSVATSLGKTATMGPLVRPRTCAPTPEQQGLSPWGFLTTPCLLPGVGPAPPPLHTCWPAYSAGVDLAREEHRRGEGEGGASAPQEGVRLFHPQPPTLGAALHVATVEKASVGGEHLSTATTPGAGGKVGSCFARLASHVAEANLTAQVRGLEGRMGLLLTVTGAEEPAHIVGKKVAKVGRTSGVTFGSILGYAAELYGEIPGGAMVTHGPGSADFLVQATAQQPFTMKGDDGALVLVEEQAEGGDCTWRPLGQALGHGRHCGVASLARLLDELDLDLVLPHQLGSPVAEDSMEDFELV